ncbi:MAG: oligosaccharide flippase family protein [Firmicutes bacterium]|nr:oligosaccharide flippase family protein [Bacillota bacterium]
MRTFLRSVALITAFAVATRGAGFLFRIILSRILGAELLGVYQIAFSFFMVFLTAIASGLPLVISRMTSTIPGDARYPTKLGQVVRSGLVIAFALAAIIILTTFATSGIIGYLFADARSTRILLFLVPALLGTAVYTVLRAVWWGQKKFFLLGLTELIEQLTRILLFFGLVGLGFLFKDMAIIAALSFTLASLLSALIVLNLFRREQAIPRGPLMDMTETRVILRSAAPITAVRVITSIALPVIAVIIPLRLVAAGWQPAEAVAGFGIAVGMTLPLLSIPQTVISSIATALVPDLASSSSSRDTERTNRQINSCIRATLLINFMLIPAFIAIGPGIGRFLFANEMAGVYLAQSAWIMIPMSLSLITNAILNSLGAETRAMMHYVIGSVALFACVWILPGRIGVGALIVGLGACTSIASVLNIHLISKKTGTGLHIIRGLAGFAVACVPAVIIGRALFDIFDTIPLFFNLAITGSITVGASLAMAYVMNLVDLEHLRIFRKRHRNLTR